jgi:hypothetical protein
MNSLNNGDRYLHLSHISPNWEMISNISCGYDILVFILFLYELALLFLKETWDTFLTTIETMNIHVVCQNELNKLSGG